ncbi:MAG: protein kinase [Rickettsiales bacterium]|jgi:serine/threonine protein kinase|nr:protein kinase [Rickettsiales bacterium]
MAPEPATNEDLENLQRAIGYNPDLFGVLKDKLAIDPVGVTINGRKVGKLGEGGFGVVYKIYHGGQWRALKVNNDLHREKISPNSIIRSGDYLVVEAFKGEDSRPQALMGIEYSSLDGSVVMSEPCDGGDWCENRSDDRELLEKNLISIISALGILHNKNIIHGDIKPENILFNGGGLAKLADFGLAMECDSDGHSNNYYGKGTPDFMAPEIWLNLGSDIMDIDLRKCDCWALGATLYEKIFHENLYNTFARTRGYYQEDYTDMNKYFKDVSNHITDNSGIWRDFIANKLNEVIPPVGMLLRATIVDLLEPDRYMAHSIDEILTDLSSISKMNDANEAEYGKLCGKSNEQVVRELKLKRKLEKEKKKLEEELRKKREEKEKREKELKRNREEERKKKVNIRGVHPGVAGALQKISPAMNPSKSAVNPVGPALDPHKSAVSPLKSTVSTAMDSSRVVEEGSILSELKDRSRFGYGVKHTEQAEPQPPTKKRVDIVVGSTTRFGYKKRKAGQVLM